LKNYFNKIYFLLVVPSPYCNIKRANYWSLDSLSLTLAFFLLPSQNSGLFCKAATWENMQINAYFWTQQTGKKYSLCYHRRRGKNEKTPALIQSSLYCIFYFQIWIYLKTDLGSIQRLLLLDRDVCKWRSDSTGTDGYYNNTTQRPQHSKCTTNLTTWCFIAITINNI